MTSCSRSIQLHVTQRDALARSLRRIETLAALLARLSEGVPCEPLEGELVGEAAGMIAEETALWRAALCPHFDPRK